MRVLPFFLSISILFMLNSCIGEDIVNDKIEESIRINTSFSNLKVGDFVVLDASFFDNQGTKQTVDFDLQSDNSAVVTVDNTTKLITAKTTGLANILVSTIYKDKKVEIKINTTVFDDTTTPLPIELMKIGSLQKTSSYKSAGDFEITAITGGIRIKFASNYIADKSLPGFAMYLTNNPNTRVDAKKIDYQGDADGVIYQGAYSLDVIGIGINDFGYLTHWCDPFNIKVGEAQIKNK